MAREEKLYKESDIHLCQYCGKEVLGRSIFCDEHNTRYNKQIYEFFVDLPMRPRGKYAFELIGDYLKARLGKIDDKRFIVKAPTGSGKSIILDLIGYLELTHFPNSFTIIGSISYPVATEHIRRIRHWVRDSIFGKYIHGMEATASKEEITLEGLHSRMLAIASQAETSRAGYHPCVLGETELLTLEGWKQIKSLSQGDIVLGFEKETENLLWEPIIAYGKYQYNGELIHFQNKHRKIDIKTTPYHRVIWKHDSKQKWRVDVAESLSTHKSIIIPASGNPIANNEYQDEIEIIGRSYDANAFLKFLGFYISEGWIHQNKKVCVSQSEESPYFFEIKAVVNKIWNEKISYDKKRRTFGKGDVVLSRWLSEFCGSKSKDKKVPKFIFKLTPEQIAIFLDAYLKGDSEKNRIRATSISKQLVDDIQALMVLVGYNASIYKNNRGEWLVAKINGSGNIHFIQQPIIEQYSGLVYAVQVPSTFVVCRYNGKVFITGNSLLLLDEIGRFRPQSYYQLFYQLGRSGGVLEVVGSTPFLDSQIMQDFWNAEDVKRYALDLDDAWWISKEQIRNAQSTLPPELFDQLYRAQFRSLTNRVIPDDIFLAALSRGSHLQQSQNLLMGVDFGQKIDPTAVVIIDFETGDVKFAAQFSDPWRIQFEKIRQIYREWKPIKVMADSSSIGSVIITELADLPIEGVSMHNDILKKRVIDRLVMAFINHKINIVADEFPLLVSQLSSYVYLDPDHKKMGPSGRGHDDFVDALGLALMAFDVSSVSHSAVGDNIWTFTRIPGSSSSPWKIGGF